MTQADLRRNAAALACEIRAMWPTLAGGWTRREWNAQARRAAHQYLSNMARFWAANEWSPK